MLFRHANECMIPKDSPLSWFNIQGGLVFLGDNDSEGRTPFDPAFQREHWVVRLAWCMCLLGVFFLHFSS